MLKRSAIQKMVSQQNRIMAMFATQQNAVDIQKYGPIALIYSQF